MDFILSKEKNMHHERLQETSGAIVASYKLSLLQNFVRSFIERRRRINKRSKRIQYVLRSYTAKCYISEKFSIWEYCLSQVRLEVIIVDRNSLSSLAPLGDKSCRLVQLLNLSANMNKIKVLPKYLEELQLLQDLCQVFVFS